MTTTEVKIARLKRGLQLLRDVSYLGKAYVKASANDNGTMSAVDNYGLIIAAAIFIATTTIFWSLVKSRSISDKCGAWLAVGILILPVVVAFFIRYASERTYTQRWRSLFKVECEIERLVDDFMSPEFLNDGYDTKIAECQDAFEKLKTAFNKKWVFSPRKIDFIRAAEVLDEDFTYKAMGICLRAGLTYREGLPESVLKNLNEDGTLKREVHDKYFAHRMR